MGLDTLEGLAAWSRRHGAYRFKATDYRDRWIVTIADRNREITGVGAIFSWAWQHAADQFCPECREGTCKR